MSKKEKEIFLKKVFFLLEEKKNFENFIFFSNFSDIFYEILKKLFKKSSKEINYKPNFMEFDGNDYSNFKEICRKIKLFLDNFCISEKSFFPFRFIFFKNFDFLSKENHTSLKNMIDTSGNYLRFFFFCGKKKNIDLCLISRSVSFFFSPINFKSFSRCRLIGYRQKKPKKNITHEENLGKFLLLKTNQKQDLIGNILKFLKKNSCSKYSGFFNDFFCFFLNIFKKNFSLSAMNFYFNYFTKGKSIMFFRKFSKFLMLKKKKKEKRSFFFLS